MNAFKLADCSIELKGDKRILSDIKQTIRNSWALDVRQNIDCIRECQEFEGTIVAVEMDAKSYTMAADYRTRALTHDGWGLFHYNASSAYYGRIVSNRLTEGYHFEGREDAVLPDSSTGIVDEIEIEIEANAECTQLLKDIVDTWDKNTLQYIKTIKKTDTSLQDYQVETDRNVQDAVNKGYWIEPAVPTGQSIEGLLTNGWCVSGITSNTMRVSKLEPVLSNNREYGFKGESVDSEAECCEKPVVCESCGSREAVDAYVYQNKTSFVHVCGQCSNELEDGLHPKEEFYDEDD